MRTQTTSAFETLYAQLNPAQKEAVDTVEGPVMVVAGPGTGKTQVLTLRIANVLRVTDADPESILALTFTDSGAYAMRKRLAGIIGSAAYRVTIGTFHSFCNGIIKDHPDLFPRIIGAESITEVEQVEILQSVIGKAKNLTLLRPYGDEMFFLRPILAAINGLKREAVDPAAFKKRIDGEKKSFGATPDLRHTAGPHKGKIKGAHQTRERQIRKNEELLSVYEIYEAELATRRRYDYNDMILEVVHVLRPPAGGGQELLLTLQERYQYILADEHQDANAAQNRVLELLASFYDDPNLFVVGDEKQAIFQFQGASLENFLYFERKYPGAKKITLTENYRSTQTILDSAHSLLRGTLRAHGAERGAPITVYAFSKPDVEHLFLAEHVRDQIARGVPPEEIAILYRDNADAGPIRDALERVGVAYAIESDEDVFTDPDVQKFVALLRAVAQPGDDAVFIRALHIDFLGVDPAHIYAFLDGESAPELKPVRERIKRWNRDAHNMALPSFFESVVRDSGLLAHLLSHRDSLDKLTRLRRLFGEVRRLAGSNRMFGIDNLIAYFDMLEAHRMPLATRAAERGLSGRVRLMTAHKAKGLEFDRVYITGARDGHWGNRKRRNYFNVGGATDEDDERRLFYVALTRARTDVTVTYSETNAEGREQLPSQFIVEIDPALVARGNEEPYEKRFRDHPELMFAARQDREPNVRDTALIRHLFERRGLSVTGLNNYLECPWRYFYVNLLRIPEAKSKPQIYGTAVHAALKDFFDRWKRGEDPGKEFLIGQFEHHLSHEILTDAERDQLAKKGKSALSGYYDEYGGEWPREIMNEFFVRGVELSSIRLVGKIDKIELLSGDDVRVVDYKTGRPRSRKDANYKRQLVFYKLIFELFDSRRYNVVSCELDFVEPNERGKYKNERFEITDEEVADLTRLIQQTADEIRSLAFWDVRCGSADCEYCKLRELMR